MKNFLSFRNYLIIFLLSFTLSGVAHASFSDTDGYKYEQSILELQQSGVVEGYEGNLYLPDAHINRAEFLKLALEGSGIQFNHDDFDDCFADVKHTSATEKVWFVPYVCFAKEKGYVQGYLETGLFAPEQHINYVEALKIIYEIKAHPGAKYLSPYDRQWYSKYLQDVLNKDIALLELKPDDLLTRGEMAELMVRFETLINTKPECVLGKPGTEEKIPIKEADPETCELVPGGIFAVDKNQIYRRLTDPGSTDPQDYQVIKRVDVETFQDLGYDFFKDKHGVYNSMGLNYADVPQLDPQSTKALSYYYVKDANGVYYLDFKYGEEYSRGTTNQFLKIEGVDVASFESLYVSDWDYGIYYKDINHVYVFDDSTRPTLFEIFEGVDLETFQVLGGSLAKDKNHVYYQMNIVSEVSDPSTFELVGEYAPYKNYISKDKDFIYKITEGSLQKIEGIDPLEFEATQPSSNLFHKNQKHVYFDFNILEGANPENFEVLGSDVLGGVRVYYSKDSESVYFNSNKITGADAGTFEIIGSGISKDKNHVYKGPEILEGVDAETFEKTSSHIHYPYYKDKNNVYYLFDFLTLGFANPDSLQILESGFAKDSQFVFKKQTILYGMDAATFELLKNDRQQEKNDRLNGSASSDYAKDKNGVYYIKDLDDIKMIEDVDIESFEWVGYAVYLEENVTKDKDHVYKDDIIFPELDAATFESISHWYFKDINGVYYYDGEAFVIVEGADLETFEMFDYHLGKDAKHFYLEGKMLSEIDVDSFEIVDEKHWSYYKDKNHVYSRSNGMLNIIEEADPETFDLYPLGIGIDKNNVYFGTEKSEEFSPEDYQ